MDELSAGFELFRGGKFTEARALADAVLARQNDHFWARYLAAIASAFAGDIRACEPYLTALETARPPQEAKVYLHYLQAWHALLARDSEKALWHYLQIADDPEGWLARALIKKFRKEREIENPALHAADYIVLPSSLPPKPRGEIKAEKKILPSGWQYALPEQRKIPRLAWAKFSWARLTIALVIAAVGVSALLFFAYHRRQWVRPTIPPLQVADSAAVMPFDKKKILHEYRTREAIINDFDQAKEHLAAKRVNKARFLLNRLVDSNADFQSREKARIFLGFIPDLPYSEFNDNLSLKEIFAAPKLRTGSLILLSGELRDATAQALATTYQFIVREGSEEYFVQAFRDGSIPEERLQSNSEKSHIQIYGRFRGLVGKQRTVYLEALRVWRSGRN